MSLERIRGTLPRTSASARTVAALTENPGCARRRVIDSAGIAAHELAESLGHPPVRGQSPFAIETGNRFEGRLKERSGYSLLVDALAPYVTLPQPPDLRVEDVNAIAGLAGAASWIDARARLTDEIIAKIARDDADAPHVVDHPVLQFDLAGTTVNLEPDALAFRAGDKLELVEIKSYAIVDGQAEPSKLSSTAGQAAVYHMALRSTLVRLGFDPELLAWSVILVAPRNFGRSPVAHRVPLKKKAMSLARVLEAVPGTSELLSHLPDDLTFDVDPDRKLTDLERQSALADAVGAVAARYVPDCVQNCDMAKFCRDEAWSTDSPSRLGRAARDSLGDVHSLSEALRLARSEGAGEESDVAAALQEAYEAIERARQKARQGSGS